MMLNELFARATEPLGARIVYAEPVERDGVVVIAAARVVGGGGGGGGTDQGKHGEGGGLGLIARPAGAFVIEDGKVSWQPAVDVNTIIATIGAVVITGLLVLGRALRHPASPTPRTRVSNARDR